MMGNAIVYAAGVWLIPILITLATVIMTPGFILPFFRSPLGLTMAVATYGTHTLMCVLCVLSGLFRWPAFARITISILAFLTMGLAILTPMLGPAVVTIMQALGPLETGK